MNRKLCALACAATLQLLHAASHAALIITVSETGGDVVAIGSGTVNLTGLGLVNDGTLAAGMHPAIGELYLGAAPIIDNYSGVTSPVDFGPGGLTVADSATGDFFGPRGSTNIIVPYRYVSNTPLSGTATWNSTTFSLLGATPGTYVYTWGSGADADSLTLQIGPAAGGTVPEAGSLALLGAGLGALAFAMARRSGAGRASVVPRAAWGS